MQSKSSGEAAFTLFKPRQVLLNSISNMKHTIENGSEPKTPISLTSQQRTLLLQSICQFLELNDFSKTLKNFRKELDFEKGSWKSCLLNLEEMCYQYLKMRNDTKVSDSAIKQQTVDTANRKMENEGVDKKKIESKTENHSVDIKKKKKKSKKASESAEEIVEVNPEDVPVSVPSEPEKKAKGKKKHKNDSQEVKKDDLEVKVHEPLAEETSTKLDVSRDEKKVKSKSTTMKEDAVETKEFDKEKKSSKKRKKSSSEENDTGCVENAAFDDPKRRKTDNLDQSNGTFLPKTPNGSANGVLEKDGKESKKGKKWQHDGSSEPRTSANAFRRVKEEEVEFVDEKLQDNSYWAKEGADSGYGAKAQEVLGQVRGRDFRHEKTKKKHGSYRGGLIDLNSHSFKFNYDDDDE